jgi:type IV secretory pathway component VirB8
MTPEQATRRHELFHSRRRRSHRDLLFVLALFFGFIVLMWAIVLML